MTFQNFLSIVSVFLFSLVCFPHKIFAQTNNLRPSLTIINLVRGNGLGHENDDLALSLKAQWQVTRETEVNATWLLQYGALDDPDIITVVKNEMSGQEFGLLFEIDRNFAQKANVLYRGQGPWYFSDGLFLNSYDRGERHALIEEAFSKFEQIFGYYPKTVGAWWIGGDSLSYMQKKYGITAALRAADQFDLDMYSLWGTPWSMPYIASRVNEAIPAKSYDDSSKVVILQWAARDPFKGYGDPLFSLQDYSMRGYGPEYVNYLADIFLPAPYTNLVIGLENGGTLEELNKGYKTMIVKAKELEKERKADILLVKDFSRQYLEQKKVFPYKSYFLSQDYDSKNQSFWYTSENYRAAIQKTGDSIYLVDVRDYSTKVDEDFDILPNTQSRLRINTPEIIDSMRFPDSKIFLTASKEPLSIKENNDAVELFSGEFRIARFTPLKIHIFNEEGSDKKIYEFGKEQRRVNLTLILSGVFILYFIVVCLKKKQIYSSLHSFLPLIIPAFFSSCYLTNSSVFLFDSRELVILTALFSFRVFSIYETLVISKIVPFIILMMAHYIYFFTTPHKIKKYVYYTTFTLTLFLYLHPSYFPLDATTIRYVGLFFVIVALGLFAVIFFLFQKHSSLRYRIILLSSIPVILGMLIFSTVFSRSALALTTYEIHALETVRKNKKDVIYVEQFENSIRPIYKSVKPLLYYYFPIVQKITGQRWEVVARPSNHIIQLTDYENKCIVIPKYLGSDISNHETNTLKLRKVFDNAQIQIFEKEKGL